MSIILEGVTKRHGSMVAVDAVSMEVAEAELFVLLGESGSGKSTILRMIAGLTPLDAGRIRLRGRDVTALPPQLRGTGFVFQNYSLFQHMTIAQNVEFGLMIRKTAADERRRVRDKLLETVGLGGLDDRYPWQLSGGQQQRVALARALAYQPDVLLLDEPFGALDAKTRGYLRHELRRIQRDLGITTIFVTHDREEAFDLADRVGVLLRGRLVASGSPQALYREPTTPYVASLLGEANLLLARVDEDGLRVGELRLPAAKAEIAVERGRQAFVHFRPEDVDVAHEREAVSGRPLGRARVTEHSFAGAQLKLRLELETAIQKPIPQSPAEEVAVHTILATLSTDHADLLHHEHLWAGLKDYRVLLGDPLRALAICRPGAPARAVLGLARILANAEAIDVRVVQTSGRTFADVGEVRDWDELEQQLLATEKDGVATDELRAFWTSHASDLPDLVLLDREEAMSLLRAMTPALDARLRRSGTAVLAVPPADVRVPRILVATAAGAPGREDVRFAARLARRVRAGMVLLHVVADQSLPLDIDELVTRRIPQAIHLKQDLKLVEMLGIPVRAVLRRGEPVREILREAEGSGAGIVVVGAHFPRPAWRGYGNLPRRIVELSPYPTAILYAKLM